MSVTSPPGIRMEWFDMELNAIFDKTIIKFEFDEEKTLLWVLNSWPYVSNHEINSPMLFKFILFEYLYVIRRKN